MLCLWCVYEALKQLFQLSIAHKIYRIYIVVSWLTLDNNFNFAMLTTFSKWITYFHSSLTYFSDVFGTYCSLRSTCFFIEIHWLLSLGLTKHVHQNLMKFSGLYWWQLDSLRKSFFLLYREWNPSSTQANLRVSLLFCCSHCGFHMPIIVTQVAYFLNLLEPASSASKS